MSIFDIFTNKKTLPDKWKKYYTEDELSMKIPDISVYDQIVLVRHRYPNNIALEYLGKKTKYKKFIKQVNRCARALKENGIKAGDIVTILLPNIPESLIAFYALNKLGAIANMTHPLSAEEEIKDTLNSTKSKMLIIYDHQYEKIEKIIKSTRVKKVIFVSPACSMKPLMGLLYRLKEFTKFKHHPSDPKYMNWKGFIMTSFGKEDVAHIKYGKDTPCAILHSGGTSGKPKNVVIQNRAFIYGAKAEGISLPRLEVGDSVLAIMPNFHGFGLGVSMHTPLALGLTTVLVPSFDANKFDVLFDQTKPTVLVGVPTLYEALLKCNNIENLDLSKVKYAISGGDILPKNLEDRVNKYLSDHGSKAIITQGYGLTEALAAVVLAHDDYNKSGSVGIPLVGNYIKIIDPGTRKSLKPKETGEIVIHSKALMMGYLNDEAETNAALQLHDDGHVWLHTGDLGYLDEDGYLFHKGRLKRMIITSGYNVYPSHVEEIIESHPAVLQCTVVGIPHEYKQEVPKAFIVLKPGFHGLFVKEEIKKYAKKHLAKYMVPTEFVIRKQLPKTRLGKVDFNALKIDEGESEDD